MNNSKATLTSSVAGKNSSTVLTSSIQAENTTTNPVNPPTTLTMTGTRRNSKRSSASNVSYNIDTPSFNSSK
ncbi:hypothetical protein BGZ97_009322, partial [Linnemannia gamsii]